LSAVPGSHVGFSDPRTSPSPMDGVSEVPLPSPGPNPTREDAAGAVAASSPILLRRGGAGAPATSRAAGARGSHPSSRDNTTSARPHRRRPRFLPSPSIWQYSPPPPRIGGGSQLSRPMREGMRIGAGSRSDLRESFFSLLSSLSHLQHGFEDHCWRRS
jgi:hypothetical protein